MNIDDFFKKVDTSLEDTAVKNAQKQNVASKNREFLTHLIKNLKPIADTYKQQLNDRGINAEVKVYPAGLMFKVQNDHGGSYGVDVVGQLETNRVEIISTFPDASGKELKSRDGRTYDESSWKDEVYEKSIQNSIEGFLSQRK